MNVDKFTKYGLLRVVDELGRMVIPVALRRKYGIEKGDELEVLDTPEGILIRKFMDEKESED
jgi:transcriptional pleiotropic regulator of transition state genes